MTKLFYQKPNSTVAETIGMHNSVLVIDSHRRDLHNTRKSLKQHGFQVIEAHNVDEALEKNINTTLAALVMDVNMKSDTITLFIRAIRRDEISAFPKDILIVGCSGEWGNGQKEHCMEAGADVFFYKPLDVYLILDCIQSKERVSARACQSDSVEAGSNKRIYTT